MIKLQTINDIFSRKFFRVPDYQRGYSWEKQHLQDFWNDLQNLQDNHFHYTGMISVKEAKDQNEEKWKDEYWLMRSESTKPYFVVDGQQRLTTIIILLWCIADKIGDKKILGAMNSEKILRKFIYREDEDFPKAYLFGYEIDNPSFYFLINKIFNEPVSEGIEIIDTTYTNNLAEAKKYFTRLLKSMSLSEIEILYEKITTKLKFDYKELEEELDIFVVFETMNNRGKPLSDLEKLKNRLIYLSTILPDETDKRREKLREKINKAWQTIYYYLGRNKRNQLSDDTFLQNHWITYYRYERREAKFYEKDIFERIFTVSNVVNKDNKGNYIINFSKINSYVSSIEHAAAKWFLIKNPTHEEAIIIEPNEKIREWLQRLDRLGLRNFSPLILAIFSSGKFKTAIKGRGDAVIIQILKMLEKYIFLLFCISNRRANTGTYHFMALASEVYHGKLTYSDLKEDISNWIFGDDYSNGYFDIENFYKTIEILFDKEEGYQSWSWIKYFLAEYEAYKTQKPIKKSIYDKLKIDIIYLDYDIFDNTSPGYKKARKLCYSLGNLILIEQKVDKRKKISERRDEYIKSKLQQVNEIGDYKTWDSKEILSRGRELIEFLKTRWKIDFDMPDEKLLFLDFLENEKD